VSGVAIQALPAARVEAERLARALGWPLHEIAIHWFPDGEMRVIVGPSPPTAVIYAPLDRPNDKLLAILFAAEALRREGAERLVLVAPYLCYMRQDAAFHAGEAISQRAIGRLLAANVDRVVTVDAHLHRTVSLKDVFPGIETENLSAMPAIADALSTSGFDRRTLIVGPDAEARSWVVDLAARLGADHALAQKNRHGDRSVDISFAEPALFAGRPTLLVDDVVSSGATLIACAKTLLAAGAVSVDAVVTHALFAPDLTAEFRKAGIRSVRSTNSVPHPTNSIVLDEVLRHALQQEFDASEKMP
jgi:ribose-phosphate pyrophosphokinase